MKNIILNIKAILKLLEGCPEESLLEYRLLQRLNDLVKELNLQ